MEGHPCADRGRDRPMRGRREHHRDDRGEARLMDSGTLVVIAVVLVGLTFEFVNGFHDAANAIATIVATRVLTPLQAVTMAGALNFVGAISGTAVATTVGKGLVDPRVV